MLCVRHGEMVIPSSLRRLGANAQGLNFENRLGWDDAYYTWTRFGG